MYGLDSV